MLSGTQGMVGGEKFEVIIEHEHFGATTRVGLCSCSVLRGSALLSRSLPAGILIRKLLSDQLAVVQYTAVRNCTDRCMGRLS